MLYLLVILAVVLGALAQRVAGLGFAMISAPMLVLLLGAFDGVLMVNLCGAISATLIITRVWQYIDWRQFVMLLIPALIFIVPGAIISVRLAGPVLQISVGAILVLALSMSMLVRRAFHRPPVLPSALVAGAVSGFTNVTAGIGGPALSVHAVLTRWDPRIFAATVQPYFVITGSMAFATKIVTSPQGLPDYDWWLWLMVLAGILVGLAIGERLSRVVSQRATRIAVVALAYFGAVVAIIDGVLAL